MVGESSSSVASAGFAAPSSALAATAKTPSSMWTGWIVPRIVPITLADNSIENNKPLKRQIEPSLLCPDTGINFHPLASIVDYSNGNPMKTIQPMSTSNTSVKPKNHLLPTKGDNATSKSESTVLDLFVLPSGMASFQHAALWKNDTEPYLHLRLDRDSQEMANMTLKRMTISLNKQISKKIMSNMTKKQREHANQNVSQTSPVIVWKVAPNNGREIWDIQNLTNQQVWTEAITSAIQVDLHLTEHNITLSLQVDSCPPTITSVQSFENFETRIFCEIPLVVKVETMFATHARIDWYLEDVLVAHDSPSYIPRTKDIGKHISVLITPLRMQQEGDEAIIMHSGRGYEEAYRFVNAVEDLPENTILKLRQQDATYDWINPKRRCSSTSKRGDDDEGEQPTAVSCEQSLQPLRVLTFNILADQNVYKRNTGTRKVSLYDYVTISVLDKTRRMPLILHEILAYQADVICLQEVDESVWEQLFHPVLEHAGYQGYFSKKIAKGMNEGCAMLWSLHRFEELPQENLKHYSLSDLVMDLANNPERFLPDWESASSIASVLKDKPDLKNVIKDKLGHIVQMVSLSLRKDLKEERSSTVPDCILVANTHLFYHPLAAHVRLMQMYAICRQFDEFQLKDQQQQQLKVTQPMILCGDMNSSLRRAAGYLLIQREVDPNHSQIKQHFNTFQWQNRKKQNTRDEEKEAIVGDSSSTKKNTNVRVEHTENDNEIENDWEDFPVIALPPHFPSFLAGYPTEPAFTHYLDQFAGSLDHIFISQHSEHNPFGLKPYRSAPMPSKDDVTEEVAMPSTKLPSDHVSLVADLSFTRHEK